LIAWTTIPILFPGPGEVLRAIITSIADGSLIWDILISYFRILLGWAIGCIHAMPPGMLAGQSKWARAIIEPYVEFFRYIPPIAFITLFLIWFGLGELSKVLLIVYSSFFATSTATMAGSTAVDIEKIRTAQCMSAGRAQVFWHVFIPATMPATITGIRVALGAAFMTVIAAEFVAADSGIGYKIFSARLFALTNLVFAGLIVLGLMGYVANRVLRLVLSFFAYRYNLKYQAAIPTAHQTGCFPRLVLANALDGLNPKVRLPRKASDVKGTDQHVAIAGSPPSCPVPAEAEPENASRADRTRFDPAARRSPRDRSRPACRP
jgi:NitT/TauT family transport system permease protein